MESFHPLVVHFPIALLLTALGIDLAAIVSRRPALHRIALWNLGLGTLGAGAAVLSGLKAEGIAKHSFEIWRVMERHQQLGIATAILSLLVLGWRLVTRDQLTRSARLAMLAAMLAMGITLSVGAHLGGRLVYEFGVGGSFGASPYQPPRSSFE